MNRIPQNRASWENRLRAIIGDRFVEIFLTSIYRAAGWFVWSLLALAIITLTTWLVEPDILETVVQFLARRRPG